MSSTPGEPSSALGGYPLTPLLKDQISQRTRSKSRGRRTALFPPKTPSPPESPEPSSDRATQQLPPPPPPRKKMSSNKVPFLNVKLSGAANYPEWITSLKLFLHITDITDEHDAWDLVTGEFTNPAQAAEGKIWQKANDLTLLTILKNCENNVRSRIGTCELAKDAYDELKKAYEGKTATEFYALLDSLTNIPFDDRKNTINEHITHYEATWNRFVGVISRADLTAAEDDGFGAGLQKFAKSDRAKSEFLLKSLPAYYSNTVENIRAKDHGYGDVARKLREYVPARQRRSRKKEADSTKDDPLVLKVENKDNGKRCQYCIAKGWKGLNHTESECRTKKREKAKAKKTKAEEEEEGSDSEGVTIKMIRIGKTTCGHEGLYEYDTAAPIILQMSMTD